ncbi:SDR family NAD(P)-dependent oxidoreductase [Gloeobacter violaceus]|uniref:Gll3943 protein n=1 Tax=Gloeobacter violaceus (strain ATCC 29082 / PCC 7421) TaxID=251221 RepID=Q7NED7_GLOVI|nr:SDR family oxidoreductase [Gloeobacter violaceus]BAC91884.1 gll3943 [Gloeobacter violaceus PCC 7421]
MTAIVIKTMLIVGASRGIGAYVAAHYVNRVEHLWTVSRTTSPVGRWLQADVSKREDIARIGAAMGKEPLDVLLYLGGVWEKGAFTDAYDFEGSPPEETAFVLSVNLTAPILLVQTLLPNLQRAANPRAVFIGSLSALDNTATREVANSASKYGLRGAVQAMQINLRPHGIGLTVINPGNVATPEVEADIAEGRFGEQQAIPLADLAAVIDCALAMSPASTITEINLAQRRPAVS